MCPNWRVSAPSHLHHCFVEVGRGGGDGGFCLLFLFILVKIAILDHPLPQIIFNYAKMARFG